MEQPGGALTLLMVFAELLEWPTATAAASHSSLLVIEHRPSHPHSPVPTKKEDDEEAIEAEEEAVERPCRESVIGIENARMAWDTAVLIASMSSDAHV